MVIKFCKKVLEFLKSKYDDAYKFEIDCSQINGPYDPCKVNVVLTITLSPGLRLIVSRFIMYGLFEDFCLGRDDWKNRLITIIEGE